VEKLYSASEPRPKEGVGPLMSVSITREERAAVWGRIVSCGRLAIGLWQAKPPAPQSMTNCVRQEVLPALFQQAPWKRVLSSAESARMAQIRALSPIGVLVPPTPILTLLPRSQSSVLPIPVFTPLFHHPVPVSTTLMFVPLVPVPPVTIVITMMFCRKNGLRRQERTTQ